MKKLFITVLVLATVICGVALNTVFYAPYGYVKECYYSESELFEKITVCLKELYKPEMSCIEYISNTGEYAERIGDTYIIKTKEAGNLYRLIEHYLQKVREHHNSTGFNYFKAYYDNDGDMVWYTAAKTDKIENNNGINEPDEVDYLLPESVKPDCFKMFEPRMKSSASGIFSYMIFCTHLVQIQTLELLIKILRLSAL